MKPENQNESAAALNTALRGWTVNTPLPPRFQGVVWQRIERAEPKNGVTLWGLLHGWFEAKVRQPAFAVSYVTVLLFLGLTVGYWQARVNTSRVESGWQARYVQSVDPYQASHR
jgi:hypothetical protein